MNDEQRLDFIRSYSNLIANLGREVGSPLWWATPLASKNPFASPAVLAFERVYLGRPAPSEHARPSLATALKFTVKFYLAARRTRSRLRKNLERLFDAFVNRENRPEPVYVIKSFALRRNLELSPRFRDPYFDDLGDRIRAQTGRPVLTIIDEVGCLDQAIEACRRDESLMPLHAFVHLSDLICLWVRVLVGLLRPFPRNINYRGRDVTALLRREYRRDLTSTATLHALIVYAAFTRLMKRLEVSHLIYTSENYPWERQCVLATRKASPATKIIGYQHTTVTQSEMNMFPGQGETAFAPVPDKLVTVGHETASILKRYGDYGSVPVVPACAFRYVDLPRDLPVRGSHRTLLVALDNVADTGRMLEFAMSNLVNRPDWQVIVRTHPAYSLDDLRFETGKAFDFENLAHFRSSTAPSLVEELGQASAVLYCWSSAGLQAAWCGVPAINFDDGRLLTHDPYFEGTHLKWKTRADDDLHALLERIVAMPPDVLARSQAQAREYLQRYFLPVTSEAVKNFL